MNICVVINKACANTSLGCMRLMQNNTVNATGANVEPLQQS